jgi:hypothetical protein
VNELILGARLALSGGRTRLVLTAAGVALGVALLLVAAAVPTMLSERRARNLARMDNPARAGGPLLVADAATTFREDDIRGRLLRATGPGAPVPPGVQRLPRPGEAVVSPALARLLRTPGGARLLRPRVPGRIVGTIGHAGLQGPSELAFYSGARTLPASARRIRRFGGEAELALSPALLLLAAVALAALLMPVAVFVAAAARFGGEARDRRLAALRLVGADRAMTVRVAAGESVLGALAGVAAGALLFLAVRRAAEHVALFDISVYTGDVRPSAPLAALVVVAVPLVAIAGTTLALRQVVLDPLGVVRRAAARPRRLAWRLVPPVLGLALLVPMAHGHDVRETPAAVAVILLLASVATLLPWVVESVVRRLGGGAVAWQLAVRRLQLDGGASARIVSGIAVAVAGAIALQTLFSGAQAQYTRDTGADLRRAQVVVEDYGSPLGGTRDRLAATPGVRGAVGGTAYDERMPMTFVGGCDVLRELAVIDRCADGDAFATRPVPRSWHAQRVRGRTDPGGSTRPGVLATPGAAARHGVDRLGTPRAVVFVKLAKAPDAIEHVRNAAGPGLVVIQLGGTTRNRQFATLRRAVLAGAAAVLALVGASMLVSLLEQVRDRRRLLAVLAAFGTRRSTLGASVLFQAAVPVALGLALAVAAGAALGALLLAVLSAPATIDWAAAAALAGVGAAVVLAVTALSLPPLWRVMRADGLRTE